MYVCEREKDRQTEERMGRREKEKDRPDWKQQREPEKVSHDIVPMWYANAIFIRIVSFSGTDRNRLRFIASNVGVRCACVCAWRKYLIQYQCFHSIAYYLLLLFKLHLFGFDLNSRDSPFGAYICICELSLHAQQLSKQICIAAGHWTGFVMIHFIRMNYACFFRGFFWRINISFETFLKFKNSCFLVIVSFFAVFIRQLFHRFHLSAAPSRTNLCKTHTFQVEIYLSASLSWGAGLSHCHRVQVAANTAEHKMCAKNKQTNCNYSRLP